MNFCGRDPATAVIICNIMFKKEKFPTTLFVAASILAFIVFTLLFFVFSINLGGKVMTSENQIEKPFGKYFLKDTSKMNDPMMTRVPDLQDVLAGPIITEDDPGIGPLDDSVYVVIYSDFKCEYCANQEKILQLATSAYSDKVRFVWKDYPEVNLMSESFMASVAARCAGEQGKFWEYHDKLFSQNDILNEESLNEIAKGVDLDRSMFTDCLENQSTRKYILNNMIEADALGITGIPFIYVNDQKISGEITFESLKKIIDAELEKSQNNVK